MSINIRRQRANQPPTSSAPDFRLNFLQVTLSTDQFSAGVLPFETRDQLRTLRENYATTHVIQRDSNEIVCIPLNVAAPLLGTFRKYKTYKASHLVRKLLQEALLRFFKENNYRVIDFHQPTFVHCQPKHDLLTKAVEDRDVNLLQWLHVYPQYTLVGQLANRWRLGVN